MTTTKHQVIKIRFRYYFSFRFPNNRDTHGINTARLAKVWMDEYIVLFYIKSNYIDRIKEKWEIIEYNQIRQVNLDLCLDTENINAQEHTIFEFVRTCDANEETQKFHTRRT